MPEGIATPEIAPFSVGDKVLVLFDERWKNAGTPWYDGIVLRVTKFGDFVEVETIESAGWFRKPRPESEWHPAAFVRHIAD